MLDGWMMTWVSAAKSIQHPIHMYLKGVGVSEFLLSGLVIHSPIGRSNLRSTLYFGLLIIFSFHLVRCIKIGVGYIGLIISSISTLISTWV